MEIEDGPKPRFLVAVEDDQYESYFRLFHKRENAEKYAEEAGRNAAAVHVAKILTPKKAREE
jgi:hypothetical protein